jgi:hypothetical protein
MKIAEIQRFRLNRRKSRKAHDPGLSYRPQDTEFSLF